MKTITQLRKLTVLLPLLVSCASGPSHKVVNSQSLNGLSYELAGAGSWVVFIHGTNLDRRMWNSEKEWLQEDFLVLTYDLRGQGRSVFPSVKYSNHNVLVELLSGLGAQNVTLVGLSAGAQVALDVALAEPVLVERMVLVSPSIAGYVPEEMPAFLSELMGFLREKDFDQANEVLLSSSIMSVPPEQVERVREMVEVNDRLWSIPYSLVEQSPVSALERLEEIKMPTLVLVGENDLEAIRTQGALLENRMPNAHKISIAGGGHLLNLTSPQLFREALAKFLKISRE